MGRADQHHAGFAFKIPGKINDRLQFHSVPHGQHDDFYIAAGIPGGHQVAYIVNIFGTVHGNIPLSAEFFPVKLTGGLIHITPEAFISPAFRHMAAVLCHKTQTVPAG